MRHWMMLVSLAASCVVTPVPAWAMGRAEEPKKPVTAPGTDSDPAIRASDASLAKALFKPVPVNPTHVSAPMPIAPDKVANEEADRG